MGHRLTDLVEVEIGKLAPAFLEDALCDVIKPVANAIRRASRSGRFFAVAPAGTKLRSLTALHTGGLLPKVDPARYLCGALPGLAADEKDGLAVYVYDPLAKAGDKDVNEPTDGLTALADDDVVYRVDLAANPCDSIVAAARRKCISFHTFTMAVAERDGPRPASAAELASDIEDGLQLCVIDAFDQEGIVVWRRQR